MSNHPKSPQDGQVGRRPPPPEPQEIAYQGAGTRNAFEETSFLRLCGKIPQLVGRIGRMAWEIDPRAVLIMIFAQVVSGVSAAVVLAATAQAMVPILGGGLVPDRVRDALPALVVVAAAASTARLTYALAQWAEQRLKPRLATSADVALVEAMCSVELSAFNDPVFADEHEAAESGAVRVDRMLYDAQLFMSSLIRLVAAGGVLTVLHPLMLPVLVLAVLPAGVGAVAEAKVEYQVHFATNSGRNVKGMMRWHVTTSRLADEVRGNSMRAYLIFWYRTMSARIDAKVMDAAPRMLRINLLSSAIGGVCLLGAWAMLVWLTVTGRVSLAVSATAVVAVRTALMALSNVVHYATSLFQTTLYLGDWRRFVDKARSLAPQRGGAVAPVCPERIRIDQVSYSYPGKTRPAVDGLSLTLNRGEVVAVVGENGSGKSTLTRLLTGLFTAEKGTVCWDGVNLAEADPDTVWERTGVVTQFFAHWPLSVRENITLGQPVTWDDDRVWRTIDEVGMREAVEELPDGLNTLLARELWGGSDLSGGQWQRIACARALYRRPAVLVLDEPTSEMDARGEHRIFQELKNVADGRITIVVTHRLENTRIADRIIVMEKGRITENGSFDQLLKAGGLFQELYALSQDR
ncbi:ABC transporter ATP-binding protein [Streptomyces netropsis]|uniref:ABC transporter ATP-binding protein n=1 Tax=Streptomyces netropsis TaxID=55404 RepID=UPI003788A5EB